jgi:signal peptidase II
VEARVIRSRRYAIAAFSIGFAVCALDVASKVLAVADLSPHRSVALLGGLITLHLYRNPGAAFNIGTSYTAIYALIAAGVLAAIVRDLADRSQPQPWHVSQPAGRRGQLGQRCLDGRLRRK